MGKGIEKMKKILSLVLSLSLAVLLTACGQSEAAKAADDKISAIGEVTLDSGDAIKTAEEAVAALSAEDKEQLESLDALTEAREKFEALELEAMADDIEAAIGAVGTVTLESADAIDAAAEAYNSAAPEVQELVENAAVLDEAKDALSKLRAGEVTELINAIGTVTVDSAESITAARGALDALSEADRKNVENASVLEEAEEQLKTLKIQLAESLLANMRVDEDKVNNTKFYSPSALKYYPDGYWAADQRSFVLPYLGRSGDNVWLRLICNYTSDDWVFFTKITFAVDDERYTKSFGYYDVVRDNAGYSVWEYVDFEPSDSDVEMLRTIAESTETIVRFEGKDYYDDLVVNEGDKQAIRDVLTAYDALKN